MIGPIEAFKALRAVVRIAIDPTELDEVFVLADLAENSRQLQDLVRGLREDPRVRKIMEAKPRLGLVKREELALLPEGTLGHAYAEFMTERGLDHEDLKLISSDESDVDWLRNHMRETHDLWHVATGFDTDVAGELGVQAFYLAQFKGPLPVLLLTIGFANTLFKGMHDSDRRLHAIARGWALGRRSRSLFGLAWSERWEQPLAELRAEHALDLDAVDEFLSVTPPSEVLAEAA